MSRDRFVAVSLIAGLCWFGCKTLEPIDSGKNRTIPSPSVVYPMEPDPGPASARPLDPEFDAINAPARSGAWLRVLVEMREQIDSEALIRSAIARRLTRSQARREALDALSTVASRGAASLRPLLESLETEKLLEYSRGLRFRNRVFVSVRREALARLRADPNVAAVIPEYDSVRAARAKRGNGLVQAPVVPPGDSWAVTYLGLRGLWAAGIDGRGTTIGVLDTGVMGTHRALIGGRRETNSWFDPDGGSPEPIDTSPPHGSQVLGCAAAREIDGRALGAAPGAAWSVGLSNVNNSYNNVTMSLAADWMIFEVQPDVVLESWGHGKANCDPRDRPQVLAMLATGIVPVFAIGNDGPDPASAQAPAAFAFSSDVAPIVVGGIDRHGSVIDSSSRGPSPCGADRPVPDLVAPGNELPVPGAPNATSLTLATGTSFAVGWVGGTAAMMLQVNPELLPSEVIQLLRQTARDIGMPGPDNDSGYGVVAPEVAVKAAAASNR
ncbi:MAG: S8 family serine peptidase [Acidobacteriota bacterium]